MTGPVDIVRASRLSRPQLLIGVVLWLILSIGLPLAASTVNFFRFASAPLGFWLTAQGCILALVALAFLYGRLTASADNSSGLESQLSLAVQVLGAATLLSFAGIVGTIGFDGLALPLGLVAGLALMAAFIAPGLASQGGASAPDFFAARFGGGAGNLARLVAGAAIVVLLAAMLKSASVAVQALIPVAGPIAVAAAALLVCAAWVTSRLYPANMVAAVSYFLIAAGFIATVVMTARATGALSPEHLSLGPALLHHADLNQQLVLDKLASVSSLTPLASPFLQLSMRNFAGLLLAVALGVAVVSYLLGAREPKETGWQGSAANSAGLAVAAVALVALTVTPLTIYSRIAFEQRLTAGVDAKAVPQPIADASGVGWVKICDQNSNVSVDVAAACAKASGQKGRLRLQDVSFTPDGLVLASHRIAGINSLYDLPLILAVILATVIAGGALLCAAVGARSGDPAQRNGLDGGDVLFGVAILLLSGFIAATASVGSGYLAAEGFALLAAGLFPALVLGLHWRGMNRSGAVAAIVVGSLIAGLYLSGAHLWPEVLYRLTGAFSDAAPAAAKRFTDLEAALTAATEPAAKDAAQAALSRHAGTVANWWGLKPAAVVLIAVPLALIAGVLGSFPTTSRNAAAPAEQ